MNIITRLEAHKAGLKHYFTGKPCKHGHVAQRYITTGNCFECARRFVLENRQQIHDARPEVMMLRQVIIPRQDCKTILAFIHGMMALRGLQPGPDPMVGHTGPGMTIEEAIAARERITGPALPPQRAAVLTVVPPPLDPTPGGSAHETDDDDSWDGVGT